MALYRILQPLSYKGGVLTQGRLARLQLPPESITILERRGAIARAATPPLTEIPGWEAWAGSLTDIEIITVEDFLEADDAVIAEKLTFESGTVQRLKADLEAVIMPLPPSKPCC